MKYQIKQNGKLKEFEVTGKVEKIFKKYAEIETATDLKRNKLSLNNYHTIPHLLHEIAQTGKTRTFITDIAEWFRKNGCTINPGEHGVNFEITL